MIQLNDQRFQVESLLFSSPFEFGTSKNFTQIVSVISSQKSKLLRFRKNVMNPHSTKQVNYVKYNF